MKDKNYYFVSKESIYDYAMLLHIPQPDNSVRIILVKVNNNEEINIYPTVEFQVKVRHQDLDYGYYDSEDHCWYGDVWSTRDIKSSANQSQLNFQKEGSYLDIEDVDLETVLYRLK